MLHTDLKLCISIHTGQAICPWICWGSHRLPRSLYVASQLCIVQFVLFPVICRVCNLGKLATKFYGHEYGLNKCLSLIDLFMNSHSSRTPSLLSAMQSWIRCGRRGNYRTTTGQRKMGITYLNPPTILQIPVSPVSPAGCGTGWVC